MHSTDNSSTDENHNKNCKSDVESHLQCALCTFECKRPSDMKRHHCEKHEEEAEKAYAFKCKHCKYRTNTKGSLKIHEQRHDVNRAKKRSHEDFSLTVHVCDFPGCNEKCSSKADMKRHKHSHDNTQPKEA